MNQNQNQMNPSSSTLSDSHLHIIVISQQHSNSYFSLCYSVCDPGNGFLSAKSEKVSTWMTRKYREAKRDKNANSGIF